MMCLMNTHYRPHNLPLTTQAAEGLARRLWSVAEVEALVAAGILLEDERFELIGGEIVPMSPKGNRHELLKTALVLYWATRLPPDIRFTPETTFRLDVSSFLEPDFVFYRKSSGLVNLKPETALLVVEIADSSLGYDLGKKAKFYAGFGIRELWVINAVKLETHVHQGVTAEGYRDKRVILPDEMLACDLFEDLAVRLGTLELV